jgi:hypothetical protein
MEDRTMNLAQLQSDTFAAFLLLGPFRYVRKEDIELALDSRGNTSM